MRRAWPERGGTVGPARNFIGSLTPDPEFENTRVTTVLVATSIESPLTPNSGRNRCSAEVVRFVPIAPMS